MHDHRDDLGDDRRRAGGRRRRAARLRGRGPLRDARARRRRERRGAAARRGGRGRGRRAYRDVRLPRHAGGDRPGAARRLAPHRRPRALRRRRPPHRWSTGPRTWSSPAATTSTRARSRTCSTWAIPRWPRRPWSACRIPEWGERVVAFRRRQPPAPRSTTAALDRRCLEAIARHKRPKEYHVVEELPRNTAGKVLKKRAARAVRDRGGAADGARLSCSTRRCATASRASGACACRRGWRCRWPTCSTAPASA